MATKYILEKVIDIETGEDKYKSVWNMEFEELFPIEEGFVMMIMNMVNLGSIRTSTIKAISRDENKLIVKTKNSNYYLEEVQ